jgi:hypothetical protein
MAEEDDRGEGFLSRWSRRKRLLEVDPPQPEAPAEAGALEPGVEPEPEVVDEELEANRLAAEAIDIDSLGKDDDFTVFLKRGVPELLRRTALRKMWRTDPVFANVDGLNDYDQDFRNPAHSVYKSLWQVGRGFLSKEEQQTQFASGRLSVPDDEAALELEEIAESANAGDPDAEPEAEAETEASALPEDEGMPVAAIEDDQGPLAEAPSQLADSDDADETEEPRRRVSIRRRLDG